jgi:hypothetical protein
MQPTEVIGVEIRQYAGEGFTTHIPRVIGQTGEAQLNKGTQSGAKRKWNEASFFAEAEKQLSPDALQAVRKLYEEVVRTGYLNWPTNISGSFSARFDAVHPKRSLFTVFSSGSIELNLPWLYDNERSAEAAERFADALQRVPQLKLPTDYRQRYVTFGVEEWAGQVDGLIDAVRTVVVDKGPWGAGQGEPGIGEPDGE